MCTIYRVVNVQVHAAWCLSMLNFVTAPKSFFIDLIKENKKTVRNGLLCTVFPILKGHGWFMFRRQCPNL
jgi:hypothetical protein